MGWTLEAPGARRNGTRPLFPHLSAKRILADADGASNALRPRIGAARDQQLQACNAQTGRGPADRAPHPFLRASARGMHPPRGRNPARAQRPALRMLGPPLGGHFDRIRSRVRRQRLQWNLVRRFDRVLVELDVGVICAAAPRARHARRWGGCRDRRARRSRKSAHRSLPSGGSSLSASGASSPPGSSGRVIIVSSSERSQREPRVGLRALDSLVDDESG